MEKNELREILADFLNEKLIQATASGQAEKNDFLKARLRPVLAKASCISRQKSSSENRHSTRILKRKKPSII